MTQRPEEAHQRVVVGYLRLLEARGWLAFWHTPNQRASAIQRKILAGLGVRAGVSDIAMLLRGGRFAVLELKAEGGKPTPAQLTYMADVKRLGGLSDWSDNVERSGQIIAGWVLSETGERAPRL